MPWPTELDSWKKAVAALSLAKNGCTSGGEEVLDRGIIGKDTGGRSVGRGVGGNITPRAYE